MVSALSVVNVIKAFYYNPFLVRRTKIFSFSSQEMS